MEFKEIKLRKLMLAQAPVGRHQMSSLCMCTGTREVQSSDFKLFPPMEGTFVWHCHPSLQRPLLNPNDICY